MKNKRILIVEDEYVAAAEVERNLKKSEGIVTKIVPDGETAIKYIEQNKIDLVLMDIKLNGKLNGIDTAAIVRTRFDIPVIYMTAYTDISMMKQIKNSEPFGYILKPFKAHELIYNIEIALNRQKIETELKQTKNKLKKNNQELQDSLAKVKLLSGLLPICANCKDIRNDKGYYQQLEGYIAEHSDATFSHGLCPKCAKKLYPEFYDKNEDTGKQQNNN
jgi:DNA-binding response OmpR family regulator